MKRDRGNDDQSPSQSHTKSLKSLKKETIIKYVEGKKRALVKYWSGFMTMNEADLLEKEIYALKGKYFSQDIINTPRGKVFAPRFTAAFGEEGVVYRYSGFERETIAEWPEQLLLVKSKIEKHCKCKLNYAFINIYEVGSDEKGKPIEHYIGWHSDDEHGIECDSTGATTICSISLGDARKFQLRKKYKPGKEKPTQIHSKILEHGSLCTMEHHTQKLLKHQVPKKKGSTKRRINITFRKMKTPKRGKLQKDKGKWSINNE